MIVIDSYCIISGNKKQLKNDRHSDIFTYLYIFFFVFFFVYIYKKTALCASDDTFASRWYTLDRITNPTV